MNKPLISIIVPTLNNEKIIEDFFHSIERQTCSRNNIEILILDGGSVDKTLEIAKKHKARVIHNPRVLADPAVDLGFNKARGDLMMVLATDNILKQKEALTKIVEIFDKDKRIYAAFPKQNSSREDTFISKYINTFTDPFSHFVYGYACNARTFSKIYKTIEHNNAYDIYDYSSNKDKPLLALAQGFVVRKGFRRSRNDEYDDIAPLARLISTEKIAYIYSIDLYHYTVKNLAHFIKKQRWATINAYQKKNYGIYHRINYLSARQKTRIKLWPIYACSIILPLIRSLYGLLRDREPMWIFHCFLCTISAYTSVYSVLMLKLNSSENFSRQ